MDRFARRIAWTSAVIHGLVHACVLLLPPLLGDVQRTFRVSLLDVLGAANLMYLAFGATALPAGVLADRLGSRTMLALASAGCAAASALVAWSPTFGLFTAGLLALGIAAGLYHPSGLSLLSRGVASGEQGRAIGIHGMGGSLGEAAAPLVAVVFASRLGWRWGFGAVAVAALLGLVLASTLPVEVRAPAPVRRRPAWRAVAGIVGKPPLRWLLLSAVAGGLVYRGLLTFLPLHLGGGGDAVLGGSLTSLVLIAGMLAQRLGGELADRLPRERLFLAEVAVAAPMLLLLATSQGLGVPALALAFGFVWYLAQPLTGAMAAAHGAAEDHGLLYGLQFALSFGVGSFATTLGGLLVGAGGTRLVFFGLGAVAVVQVAAALALVRGRARVLAARVRSPRPG